MSSLIVASYLDLMMLEISIDKLYVPRRTEFDSAILKKSVVMFRLLDKDWTSFCPHRSDYQTYHGSNLEEEPFNGGVSVVFALPQSAFEERIEENSVDLELNVRKEVSKYFEGSPSENVGLARIDTCDLFNKVIENMEHRDRKSIWTKKRTDDLRGPIAASSKDTYPLLNEDGTDSRARITIFLRVTHLGHSIISEIELPVDKGRLFYAQQETNQGFPYQCRELTEEELTAGCWGSTTLIPPVDPGDTCCNCCNQDQNSVKMETVVEDSTHPLSVPEESSISLDSVSDVDGGDVNFDDPLDRTSVKRTVKTKLVKKRRNVNKSSEENRGEDDTATEAGRGFKTLRKAGNTKSRKKRKGSKGVKVVRSGKVMKMKKGNGRAKGPGGSSSGVKSARDGRLSKRARANKGNKYGANPVRSSVSDGSEESGAEEKTVSCSMKPSGCGQVGTCRLPDKKGKFGKCGRPDGEGGDPGKCGEKRKCARRQAPSGTVTVGYTEKKVRCTCEKCTPVLIAPVPVCLCRKSQANHSRSTLCSICCCQPREWPGGYPHLAA